MRILIPFPPFSDMFFFSHGNRFELFGHAKPTSYCSVNEDAIIHCLSFSFSLSMFLSLILLSLLLISHLSERVEKRNFVLAPCLLFIPAHFLTCLACSFFPSPSFHPPSPPLNPQSPPLLISSRCVSCIPLVRAEGEGSLKRRPRGEKLRGRGVRASGRESST